MSEYSEFKQELLKNPVVKAEYAKRAFTAYRHHTGRYQPHRKRQSQSIIKYAQKTGQRSWYDTSGRIRSRYRTLTSNIKLP